MRPPKSAEQMAWTTFRLFLVGMGLLGAAIGAWLATVIPASIGEGLVVASILGLLGLVMLLWASTRLWRGGH